MDYLSAGTPEPRHRLVILTDMENEPDDSQTMVKLLLYSNEIDIEGLVAVSSRWLPNDVFPESIRDRVLAYGIVRSNLQNHAAGWPTAEKLLERVAGGQRGYGMSAVGAERNTAGSELIIRAVDAPDPRPVWVAINAGANTLAQALWEVRASRSAEELRSFVAKLRVYDDSGQDDATRVDLQHLSRQLLHPKSFPGLRALRPDSRVGTCAVGAAHSVRMGGDPRQDAARNTRSALSSANLVCPAVERHTR